MKNNITAARKSSRTSRGVLAMGLILSVLLITAFLAGYLLLALVIFAPQGPAWRVVRRARIAVVSGRVYNLDREYEELLRR